MYELAVRAVCLLLFVAPLAACDSSSSPASPTAVSPPPPTVETFTGNFTVTGAAPAGECLAGEFQKDRGRQGNLQVTLGSDGKGHFLFLAAQCDLVQGPSSGGELVLSVAPYCGWEFADWDYSDACGEEAQVLSFSKLRLPAPDTERRIRGAGVVELHRVTLPGPPIEVKIEVDLRP